METTDEDAHELPVNVQFLTPGQPSNMPRTVMALLIVIGGIYPLSLSLQLYCSDVLQSIYCRLTCLLPRQFCNRKQSIIGKVLGP